MSERFFRMFTGAFLWMALVMKALTGDLLLVYALIALLVWEFASGWRVPQIVSRLRYGKVGLQSGAAPLSAYPVVGPMDAERMLRLIVLGFVVVPVFILPELLWFVPWFVAGMLISAGITNICPMVMFLRFMRLE